MEFGQKIKAVCEQKGISLKKFSELADIPYSTIKKYSMGKYAPGWDQISKMANAPELTEFKQFLLSDSEETINEPQLSEREAEVLEKYRAWEASGKGDDFLKALDDIESKDS